MFSLRFALRFSGVAAALVISAVAFAQAPTHVYGLNNSLSDALGGPAITNSLGGVLGANGVTFGPNQGLSLSNVFNAPTYSIETQFSITDTGGYRRLIDFLNRTSDTGLYNLNTSLNFFSGITGPAGAIPANTLTHLIVTRDGGTNAFTGYINGVSQFSFTDSSGLSKFTGPNNIAYFFVDDLSTPGEASGGFVDYIRTYSTALNQAEVTNRYNNRDAPFQPGGGAAAPEPSSLALLSFAAVGIIGLARRRKK